MRTPVPIDGPEVLRLTPGVVAPETLEWTRTAALGILGYGLLAAVVAAALAFGYRSGTVRRLEPGPAILVGLAVPSTRLTVELWQRGAIVADSPLTHHSSGAYLLGVVTAGTALAAGGHRIGDHLARGVFDIARFESDGAIADHVRSAGLAVAVTLPDSIGDAAGYPTVGDDGKRRLEGRTLLFPRRVAPDELQSRLRRRLETDFELGYVHVELTDEGPVESLAIGGRRAGISSTLPSTRVAVAVRADCAPGVSVGDPVEVWTTGPDSSRLVATGTLRASSGAVTTLVVGESDVDAFERETRYRLTTRPAPPSDAGELVAAIRAADETITTVTVDARGPLENEFAGWVPGTVLAIDRDDEVLTRPMDNEPLQAEDTLYVFATPEQLRTLSERIETGRAETGRVETSGSEASEAIAGIGDDG